MKSLIMLISFILGINLIGGDITMNNLIESGQGGYDTYRIPGTVTLPPNKEYPNGAVLAFFEARKDSSSDHGEIDVVLKRSLDNGKTWTDKQIVWADKGNTCGNPCPVYDKNTGKVFLLMCWNYGQDSESAILNKTGKYSRRVYVSESDDYGVNWTTPKNITDSVKDTENWTWYATGPGNGIQIQNGEHTGRLVIPCNHNDFSKDKTYYAHIIYSDDNGKTWHKGNSVDIKDTNEDAVVELEANGTIVAGELMLNMRNQDRSEPYRKVSCSQDGGINWSGGHLDKTLITPRCEGSFIRYSWTGTDSKNILLFSNPANKKKRKNLTVRLSEDNGNSWTAGKTIYSGDSAYSSLTKLNNGNVMCIFEADGYKYLKTAIFDISSINNK